MLLTLRSFYSFLLANTAAPRTLTYAGCQGELLREVADKLTISPLENRHKPMEAQIVASLKRDGIYEFQQIYSSD